jgi:D-alanyl-lipoteichoic acid acyltransferase DltB (MBOAT superfamily)
LERHEFDYDRVTAGLRQMAWGFFKKVVIADRLAFYVNEVYNNPTQYQGVPVVVATVFFGFQIYCDFSGYSDIAIGAARVMGFRLMNNFDRPYQATSIADFWRRWHISLSTWFRDYVYIPLGGNRVGKWHWYSNLLMTFMLSGLWHGASWTFVIWGMIHGMYMVVGAQTRGLRAKLASTLGLQGDNVATTCLKVVVTFSLVSFAWIFFRANSLADALLLVGNLVPLSRETLDLYILRSGEINLCFVLLGILAFVELSQGPKTFAEMLSRQRWYFRWATYYALVGSILFLGKYDGQEFIYFQF